MQGLAVIPLFAGYDEETRRRPDLQLRRGGRPVGGAPLPLDRLWLGLRQESLKKLYTDDMSVTDAVLACVQALYDAADDDSATGGPDLTRRIFPVIATITDDGFRRLPDAESADYAQQVVDGRMRSPDGPSAPLRTAS